MTDFLPTTPADKVEIHSNGSIEFIPNPETPQFTVDEKLDMLSEGFASLSSNVYGLHTKMDNALQGLSAVYNGLDYLIKMLSAVQQVAGMMPGMGKRIKTAMDAMDKNGSAPRG